MKRITAMILTFFLLSAFAWAETGVQGEMEPAGEPLVSAEQARTYVEELLSGDAEALEGAFLHTEELMEALTQMGGLAGLQKQLKTLGKLKGTGTVSVKKTGDYTSFAVPCRFTFRKLNIVLNADQEGRIGGIVTDVYAEGEETDPEDPALETGSGGEGSGRETESAGEISWREKALALPVNGLGELPGILTLPDGEGPFPAVVLVHGSGPHDMDETLADNKPFRDLAEGLAERGIAVYRYDKRTYVYGNEMASDFSLTLYGETIEDAAGAVSLLAGCAEIDPDRIWVLGHSLGGQALPAINDALESPAAGFIFMAAPARDLLTLLREQYDFLYSMDESEADETEKAQREEVYAMLDRLEDPDSLPEEEAVFGAYPAYWKFILNYNALETAEQISVPCLVLQGEEDYQVSMEDFELWKNAFEAGEEDGGEPQWSFRSYPGLTHIFSEGKKENAQADYFEAKKVSDEVIGDIAGFILSSSHGE